MTPHHLARLTRWRHRLGVTFAVGLVLGLIVLTRLCGAGGSDFNGSTSYIQIPHQAVLTPSSFSIGCWVRYEGFGEGNLGRIMEKSGDWAMRVEATGARLSFQAAAWTTDGNWYITTLPSNTWGRVVVTYDSGSPTNDALIYLDGVSQTVTESSNPAGTWIPGPADLFIGNSDATAIRTFDGQLADCFVANRVLSAGEVLQDYTAGPLSLGPTLVGLWGLGELGSFNRTSTAGLNGTDTAISVSTVTGPPRRYLSLSSGEWP